MLVINQHHTFAFGGNCELFDAWGSKELGPVGEGVERVIARCGVQLE